MEPVLLSIDQGTTGTKIIVMDSARRILSQSYQKHRQYYPRPGWVEHDPEELWTKIKLGVMEALNRASVQPGQVAGIGLANQGETVLFFDGETGQPLYPAVVWSCKRSAALAEEWSKKESWAAKVTAKTGLRIDPYYSATKIRWMMEEVPAVREWLQHSSLRCATTDAWFIHRMTAGASYMTDSSTASRTMLFNIRENQWDDEILQRLDIGRHWLPEVTDSAGHFGITDPDRFCGIRAPILVNMVDQAASMYGHLCTGNGMSKCTYGTGSFIYMNTGHSIHASKKPTVDATILWSHNGDLTYCLDTSVPAAGSVLEWGMKQLALYKNMDELMRWSRQWHKHTRATENERDFGLYFVPAFSGLGTPHWNAKAKGMLVGLTHYADRQQIARALLEGIAWSVTDCLEAIIQASGQPISTLRVDGGPTQNPYLMQCQADLTGLPVEVQAEANTTGVGLAYFMGEQLNWWSHAELQNNKHPGTTYFPSLTEEERLEWRKGWDKAVRFVDEFYGSPVL